MVATGLALSGCKQTISKLLAVVGQQFVYLDRAGLVQGVQKGLGTGVCLVGLDGHKHSARGPVDSHKQVAPLCLVLHLRQVLHVHVQEPRLVTLEGLVGLLWSGRFEGIEIAYAVAAQAPVQPRARDSRAQKFARDGQQIIKRQQQGAAQMYHHDLLGRSQLCLQPVRCVRSVAKDLTFLPFVDRLLSNAVVLGKDGCGHRAGSDLCAHGRRVRAFLCRAISMTSHS